MSTFSASALQDEDENLAVFRAVIAAVNFEAIPNLASSIRQERDGESEIVPRVGEEQSTTRNIHCTVSSKPLFGSYNILYPIEFADGVRWLIKIPAKGYSGRWTDSDARAITSEALTMRLVKQKTTIPLPQVFSFQSTIENELHCPFILMEFIEGVSLHEFWFDNSQSTTDTEQRRQRVLEKVASAIIQLNRFRFHEGGSLLFDDNGQYEIGPMQRVDHQAMLDRLQTDEEDEPTVIFEAGPFNFQRDFYRCSIRRREAPPDKVGRGFHKVLRLLLGWIPYTDNVEQTLFVLTHPDFDIQNIIVAPDGELRGIIDWDGVAAEPSCLGNERYPSWLTRDWDPMTYGYRPPAPLAEESCSDVDETQQPDTLALPENEQSCQDEPEHDTAPEEGELVHKPKSTDTIKENSPDELSRYREMYQGFIAALATQAHEDVTHDAGNVYRVPQPEACVQLTRNSLMIENLAIAADNPMCTDAILEKIFEEVVRATEGEYNDDSEDEDDGSVDDAESEKEADSHAEATISDFKMLNSGVEAAEGTDEAKNGAEGTGSEVEDITELERGADAEGDECFDLGGFNLGDVALALADGELDEARLARLKAGFTALCS